MTTTTVRLAIIGSTQFVDDPDGWAWAANRITHALELCQPATVISGGARGIDSLAASVARRAGIPVVEHRPKYQRWEPEGFKDRNKLIAADCTHLLAIRHAESTTYGTGWTADLAEALGKVVARVTYRPHALW